MTNRTVHVDSLRGRSWRGVYITILIHSAFNGRTLVFTEDISPLIIDGYYVMWDEVTRHIDSYLDIPAGIKYTEVLDFEY